MCSYTPYMDLANILCHYAISYVKNYNQCRTCLFSIMFFNHPHLPLFIYIIAFWKKIKASAIKITKSLSLLLAYTAFIFSESSSSLLKMKAQTTNYLILPTVDYIVLPISHS